MTKPKTKRHASRKTKLARNAVPKPHPKPMDVAANPDCPYRVGTLYAALFVEGNRDYVSKDELIKRVAEMTGKPIRSVEFGYQVLKSKSHRSNGGRSMELTEGDKIKLIALKKPH